MCAESKKGGAVMEKIKHKKVQEIQKTNSKMKTNSPSIQIIILNVKRLNSPIKRQRFAE